MDTLRRLARETKCLLLRGRLSGPRGQCPTNIIENCCRAQWIGGTDWAKTSMSSIVVQLFYLFARLHRHLRAIEQSFRHHTELQTALKGHLVLNLINDDGFVTIVGLGFKPIRFKLVHARIVRGLRRELKGAENFLNRFPGRIHIVLKKMLIVKLCVSQRTRLGTGSGRATRESEQGRDDFKDTRHKF